MEDILDVIALTLIEVIIITTTTQIVKRKVPQATFYPRFKFIANSKIIIIATVCSFIDILL